MDNLLLDHLSVSELRELKTDIENAIRAKIRATNIKKEAPDSVSETPMAAPAAQPFDLERERDAWIAKKMAVGRVGR